MKYLILLFIAVFSLSVNAQDIEKDGKIYQVKNERIFLDGKDITDSLQPLDKELIFKQAAAISEKIKLKDEALIKAAKSEKEAKALEKDMKKAEKAQKKAEKAQKKAEKELKKQLKAKKRYEKATKKLNNAQKKYDRLSRKGKLSPEDDKKWLKKLDKLQSSLKKAKKKM